MMSLVVNRKVLIPAVLLGLAAAVAGCAGSRIQQAATAPAPPARTPPSAAAPVAIPPSDARPFPPASSVDTISTNILAWDAKKKKYDARPLEEEARFTFNLTNVCLDSIAVYDTSTSCGCTVAKLPGNPWVLAPGNSGQINVAMDLRGKVGAVSNLVTIFTSKGNSSVEVEARISRPAPPEERGRARNQAIALANRQAVFRGDCAVCHVEPARGKSGPALYDAACGICHDSPRRASSVPDLHTLKEPMNLDFWKTWTANGRPGTMMPAFAASQGGPLTDKQIAALAKYLNKTFHSSAGR